MAVKMAVDGDDLLFRFFQDVLASDSSAARGLPHLLVTTLGIWWPLEVYEQVPVLLPWVVRDPKCRGQKKNGVVLTPDEWSSPDSKGFLRDDNSLVKGLVKSLVVEGPSSSHIAGKKLGKAFVASHIWRTVNHRKLASRIPRLNSFVPNLVWLPRQVAKLSDEDGGAVQTALKAVSWTIYRSVPVRSGLESEVEEIWGLLPEPPLGLDSALEDELNWFEAKRSFIATRRSKIATVVAALERLERGGSLNSKVISTRYTAGLPHVSPVARAGLLEALRPFA